MKSQLIHTNPGIDTLFDTATQFIFDLTRHIDDSHQRQIVSVLDNGGRLDLVLTLPKQEMRLLLINPSGDSLLLATSSFSCDPVKFAITH